MKHMFSEEKSELLYQNQVRIGRNLILSEVTGRKHDDVTNTIIYILQCCRWYHHPNLLTTFHHFTSKSKVLKGSKKLFLVLH